MSKNKQGKAYGSMGIENGKFAIVEGYKLVKGRGKKYSNYKPCYFIFKDG
ncbi:MAG: hypothetical protein ACI4IU_03530 [Candidatus Limousia pullorum]